MLFELLRRTTPGYLVISANKGNQYGHPPVRMLRDLARFGHGEDLREKERRRQAASDLIVRANLIDELTTYMPDKNAPVGSKQYRSRTSGDRGVWTIDGMKPVIYSDQRAVDAARAALPLLTPTALEKDAPRMVPSLAKGGTGPFFYHQVLITGERGDVSFLDGKPTFNGSLVRDPFLAEMLWHELRYLTDREIGSRPDWSTTQLRLAARASDRFDAIQAALKLPPAERPWWLRDIELIVAKVKGWTSYTGVQMDAALSEWCQSDRAWTFIRAHDPKAEWRLKYSRPTDGDIEDRRRLTERELERPLRDRAERRVGNSAASLEEHAYPSEVSSEAQRLLNDSLLIAISASKTRDRMTLQWAQLEAERHMKRGGAAEGSKGEGRPPIETTVKTKPAKPRKP